MEFPKKNGERPREPETCPQETDGDHGVAGGHRRPAARQASHAVRVGAKWRNAVRSLQRTVALTAIQFVLFEPVDRVKGNDEVRVAADKLIKLIVAQLKTLKTKKSDW